MKKSVIITINGRVQGVGFRYFLKQKAELYEIAGFVKNLAQGSVYVEAEGEISDVEAFIDFCKIGPQNAFVSDIYIQSCPLQNFKFFSIK